MQLKRIPSKNRLLLLQAMDSEKKDELQPKKNLGLLRAFVNHFDILNDECANDISEEIDKHITQFESLDENEQYLFRSMIVSSFYFLTKRVKHFRSMKNFVATDKEAFIAFFKESFFQYMSPLLFGIVYKLIVRLGIHQTLHETIHQISQFTEHSHFI